MINIGFKDRDISARLVFAEVIRTGVVAVRLRESGDIETAERVERVAEGKFDDFLRVVLRRSDPRSVS
jgi:hypothetical protein